MGIINGMNYVDKAEAVIMELIRENNGKILSTSQLRKQLAMTVELSAMAEASGAERLSQDILERIAYLRVQFVYQAGREQDVKKFIEKAQIISILKSLDGSTAEFLTFCRYMEALVAYRKFHGKKDQ